MGLLQSVKHVLAAAALFGGIAVMGQAVSAQEPASSSGTEQSPREGQEYSARTGRAPAWPRADVAAGRETQNGDREGDH